MKETGTQMGNSNTISYGIHSHFLPLDQTPCNLVGVPVTRKLGV